MMTPSARQTSDRTLPVATMLRFVVVGGLCVVLNLGVLYVGAGLLALNYLVSVTIAFAVVNWIGFLLNKHFAFRDRQPQIVAQAIRYYGLLGASLAANLMLMTLLVDGLGLNYLVASLFVSVLFAALNFLGHLRITFAPLER